MGVRFRKRIKIAKGLTINVSNGGVSATVGRPGASVNVGSKNGPSATVGVPGSGVSYTKKLGAGSGRKRREAVDELPSDEPMQLEQQSASLDPLRAVVIVLFVFAVLAWLTR